ncbi:hypothetical protein A2U01_0097684, partial [Trifolium medium]|nr:hypothetical protein [Trifolium medium]
MSRRASTMPEDFSLQSASFGLLSRNARWARDCSLGEQRLICPLFIG